MYFKIFKAVNDEAITTRPRDLYGPYTPFIRVIVHAILVRDGTSPRVEYLPAKGGYKW
jgi:hypothetical protein